MSVTNRTTSSTFRTDNYEVRHWDERGQWYVVNRETGNHIGDFFTSQGAAERWMVRCQEDYEAEQPIGRRLGPVLTTAEAAAELGVNPSRVRQLVREGLLPARKIGRDLLFDPAHLDRVRHRRGPGRPRKEA